MNHQVSLEEIKEMGELFKITDATEMRELRNPEKLEKIFSFLANNPKKTKHLGKIFGQRFDGTLPYLRKAVNICLLIEESPEKLISVEEIARKLWYEGFEDKVNERMKKYCIEETEPYLKDLETLGILKLISNNGRAYVARP